MSPEGIITYVAPNVEFLLGYLPSELIGMPFDHFAHPKELPPCKVILQQTMVSGANQSGLEHRIRHKNGNWLWFISNTSLVLDSTAGATAFLGIGRDITYRKRAERALHILNEELEKRVLERTKSAFQPSVDFDIQFVGKIKSAVFGGEGFFYATLAGPGRVWLQSLPLSRLANRIILSAPAAGGRSVGQGSLLGAGVLGGILGSDD